MMYSPRFCGLAKPGLGPAAELLFGIAQKVTKKASPTPRLFPAVLATCGTRTNRPMARKSARGGLMVRVYDRPLLRSSARADGAFGSNIDRFAIRLREPGCEHPGYVGGERDLDVSLSRSDQMLVCWGPRVFDPEERSNRRSKTKTMSPLRAVSAPSGDLFWSRLLRAPQEKGEYWGRLLLVTFLGEARKVTGPARPRSALVADIKHHSVKPFDKLRANGSSAVVAPQSTLACINLRWVETHPTNSHWHRAATERAVRAGALPC
jgi:hypothetical protein